MQLSVSYKINKPLDIGDRIPETDAWMDEYIENADISYTIERGLKRGKLHVHILYKFKSGNIQLNYTSFC